MDIAESYFEAVIPDPCRILGLKLKPFSLGHYFILRRFGCAFVAEENTTATRNDLLLGVLACSMEPKEFWKFLEQKNFFEEIRRWGKKVGLFDIKEKAAAFAAYLAKSQAQPEYWVEEEGDESGGHWSQALLTTLTGQLGYSKEDVYEMPLAQAIADFFKFAECAGMIRLMTKEELQELKAQEEAAKLQEVPVGS